MPVFPYSLQCCIYVLDLILTLLFTAALKSAAEKAGGARSGLERGQLVVRANFLSPPPPRSDAHLDLPNHHPSICSDAHPLLLRLND